MISHIAYFKALTKEKLRWEKEQFCDDNQFLKGILYGIKISRDIAEDLVTEKVPGKYTVVGKKGKSHV